MTRGPQFVEYFGPVLEALKALGGSARPAEVEDWIAEKYSISKKTLDSELASGASRYKTRVHWARFYLAKADLIDSSVRGVWSLTEKGRGTDLSHEEALSLFYRTHKKWSKKKSEVAENEVPASSEPLAGGADLTEPWYDHKVEVLNVLMNLPPEGFERLCQRILRESGFHQVTITGRGADGGIDGHGILRLNPLVSFSVHFQCKRYSNPVGAATVRDFRGAMMGRADRGIILTTATFTREAKKEAARDGVPPIELVDGSTLVEMLEKLELGLKPRKEFDIDEEFFKEFGYQSEDI